MVEAVKFETAVVTRPYFQSFLKMIRGFQPDIPLNIYRLVDGYDVTLRDELIIKARGKNRGYFIMCHPSFVQAFKKEENAKQ